MLQIKGGDKVLVEFVVDLVDGDGDIVVWKMLQTLGKSIKTTTPLHPEHIVAVRSGSTWSWVKERISTWTELWNSMFPDPGCPLSAPRPADCQNFKPVVQKTLKQLQDEKYGILPEDNHGTILAKVMLWHGFGVKKVDEWPYPGGSNTSGCLLGHTKLTNAFSWVSAESQGYMGKFDWWSLKNKSHSQGRASDDLLVKVMAL